MSVGAVVSVGAGLHSAALRRGVHNQKSSDQRRIRAPNCRHGEWHLLLGRVQTILDRLSGKCGFGSQRTQRLSIIFLPKKIVLSSCRRWHVQVNDKIKTAQRSILPTAYLREDGKKYRPCRAVEAWALPFDGLGGRLIKGCKTGRPYRIIKAGGRQAVKRPVRL